MITSGATPPVPCVLHADLRSRSDVVSLRAPARSALLAPLAALPRRRDHAHAEHALGRAQEVDAAGDRPPAIAGGLEEAEALQPFLARERRRVGIEAAAGHVEAEQRQPVLEAVQADEAAVPRRRLLAAEVALGAVQRKRIEARRSRSGLRGASRDRPRAACRCGSSVNSSACGSTMRSTEFSCERQLVRIGERCPPADRSRRVQRDGMRLWARNGHAAAGRSAARGSRRCRRPSGRSTPARGRARSGRAAWRTSRRAATLRLTPGAAAVPKMHP